MAIDIEQLRVEFVAAQMVECNTLEEFREDYQREDREQWMEYARRAIVAMHGFDNMIKDEEFAASLMEVPDGTP